MAPPIDAREKLGVALRQVLTQTPLLEIPVSTLTRSVGVTRQAFCYHSNSLDDLNAWVFRMEVTAHLTTGSREWFDAIEVTITWMHAHHDEIVAVVKTIEANDLWALLVFHIQELTESHLPDPASATVRDAVTQHFTLATTAHMIQWMLSGLEISPSPAITYIRVPMTDQTTPALGRLTK